MKALLLIERLEVENANAISGITWGFPSITHFLGMTHALSRYVNSEHGLKLGGCAVICHWHQVKAHQPSGKGEYVFSLSRNPLVMNGQQTVTPPFNEEGKMHMEVSLLIECDFTQRMLRFQSGNPEEDAHLFGHQITEKLNTMRVAGGHVTSIQNIAFKTLPENDDELQKWSRKQLLRLLPGYALVDRTDLLTEHHAGLQQTNPNATRLDAWLDFCSLKYRSHQNDAPEAASSESNVAWELSPKPAPGWLVPIMTGYQAISPLYGPGEVTHTRDLDQPFRFVESVYGIGQWLSPHRVHDLEQLIWHYHHHNDDYLCINNPRLRHEASTTQ